MRGRRKREEEDGRKKKERGGRCEEEERERRKEGKRIWGRWEGREICFVGYEIACRNLTLVTGVTVSAYWWGWSHTAVPGKCPLGNTSEECPVSTPGREGKEGGRGRKEGEGWRRGNDATVTWLGVSLVSRFSPQKQGESLGTRLG